MLVSRDPSHSRNDCIDKNNLAWFFLPYNLKIIFSPFNEESTEWGAHTSGLALTVPAPSSSATWGRLLPCGKRALCTCLVSWAGSPSTKGCRPQQASVIFEAVTQKPLKTYCHSARVCRDQNATELNKMWEWVPPSSTSVDILYDK